MNRIVPALLCALAAAPASAAERRLSVTDFDRVQVEGPYIVTLRTGLPSAARIEGSQAALDRITVDVQGRTLRIRANRSAWGGYPGESVGPVTVELSTRDLRGASVNGSGSLAIDRVRGLRVDLTLTGSGRLSVGALDADNLVLGLVGSGRVAISGRARHMRATVQGTGDLAAASLFADDAQLFADSSGLATFTAGRSAKVRATGPGDVQILGRPSCTVEGPAAAGVRCGSR
jgi:hypothetical protein